MAADQHPYAAFLGATVLDEQGDVYCHGGGQCVPRLGMPRRLRLPGEPDYIMGCCLLVRTSAIDDIGMLDERFFMYSEEVEWQLRGRDAGWGLQVASLARVTRHASEPGPAYYYYKNRGGIILSRLRAGRLWALAAGLAHLPVVFLDKPSLAGIREGLLGVFDGLKGRVGPRY